MPGDKTKKGGADKEHNCYKDTLKYCDTTLLPGCTHAVSADGTNPASAIATKIQGGGWECTEADTWVAELLLQTKNVVTAFQDANQTVHIAWAAEPDEVPAHHYHGLSWNRTWAIQRHNL